MSNRLQLSSIGKRDEAVKRVHVVFASVHGHAQSTIVIEPRPGTQSVVAALLRK